MTIKMGVRCFLVLVSMIHLVSSLGCHNVFSVDKTTCDECIRCGGVWCSDPKQDKQCKNPENGLVDNWCPDHIEKPYVQPISDNGIAFVPQYVEQVAEINAAKITNVKINGFQPVKGIQKPQVVYNTTIPSGKSMVIVKVEMNNDKIKVTTKVKDGFCSENSPKFEYVFVEVSLPQMFANEKVILKYHVPCGCSCSEKVVPKDEEYCHGHGNLTCGSCECDDDRKGRYCEKKKCQSRGDVSESCKSNSTLTMCSGNGECDECQQCECYDDPKIEGSQYFDPDHDCSGLCTTINNSDSLIECIKNNTEGPCEAYGHDYIQRWNETLLEQRDNFNRSIWVKCSVNSEIGVFVYWAMKVQTFIYMMRNDIGDSGALVNQAGGNVTIPVVIGVIAAIAAAVAAAVGYVMWNSKGALPAAGSNYANIEPEDSVGVNPLYKPPTSSFKNPMYAAKS